MKSNRVAHTVADEIRMSPWLIQREEVGVTMWDEDETWEPAAVWTAKPEPAEQRYCQHDWHVESSRTIVVFGNPGSYIENTWKCSKCGKTMKLRQGVMPE